MTQPNHRSGRRHPHLTRCRWHGCSKNAVQGLHLDFCRAHLRQIRSAEAEAMQSPGLLERCGWAGCVEYALTGAKVKFCLHHLAVTTSHGLKDQRVARLVEEMHAAEPVPVEAEQPKPKRPEHGHIYFLLSDNAVKIGWTSDLEQRMKSYSPGTKILAVMPGVRKDETRLHRKFAHLRTNRREWFAYSPQVMEEVERIVKEHGDPPRDLNEPMTTARIIGPRINGPMRVKDYRG